MTSFNDKKVLAVDLDGSLIKTDILFESFILLIKQSPFLIINCLLWLIQGKAKLKYEISQRVEINHKVLPYNKGVLDLIEKNKYSDEYEKIILATASNEKYAKQIAEYLNIEFIASDENNNLKSHNKLKEIQKEYGDRFDYVGDSFADLAIWAKSETAFVVGNNKVLIKALRNTNHQNIEIIPRTEKNFFLILVKSIRVHQWSKNLLLFACLIAAHQFSDFFIFIDLVKAFFAFSFCASSVYLLNDLIDLEDDRQHHSKQSRPLASGTLSIQIGLCLQPLLLISSLIIAYLISWQFFIALIVYFALTTTYSFYLKRIVVLDIVCLASLYLVRIVVGAIVAHLPLTFWFLIFMLFLFLNLAVLKRYIEIKQSENHKTSFNKRGYIYDDINLIPPIGFASSYISILILALHINNSVHGSITSHPILIMLLSLILLYWYTRLWFLANRGKVHEDPVVFVSKDIVSVIIGIVSVLIVYFLT